MDVFNYAVFAFFPLVMAYAATLDVLAMTIPNRVSLIGIAGIDGGPMPEDSAANSALRRSSAALTIIGIGRSGSGLTRASRSIYENSEPDC